MLMKLRNDSCIKWWVGICWEELHHQTAEPEPGAIRSRRFRGAAATGGTAPGQRHDSTSFYVVIAIIRLTVAGFHQVYKMALKLCVDIVLEYICYKCFSS
jgi:hypothetical protein